jgi:hypothetical protein
MKNYYLTLGLSLLSAYAFSQNVGIGTPTPTLKLDVETNVATDGIQINNTAANGDPILQFATNGTAEFTMGVDDSDADKFKIGTTAITTNPMITLTSTRLVGIRMTAPTRMLEMNNAATNVGADAMAMFENQGAEGVALSGYDSNAANPYNGIEGLTNYLGAGFIPAGVFGLALGQSAAINAPTIGARGHSNEWQGTGVMGSRFNSGGANNGWGGEFYDDLGYTGFFGLISDERTKKDITPIDGALAIVGQLNPVTYNYDLDKYPNMGLNTEMEYGFIAQEVKTVIPEVTREKTFDTKACVELKPHAQVENSKETFVVMDYTRVIPILTKAIQEQQELIDQQQKQLELLQKQVEELKK